MYASLNHKTQACEWIHFFSAFIRSNYYIAETHTIYIYVNELEECEWEFEMERVNRSDAGGDSGSRWNKNVSKEEKIAAMWFFPLVQLFFSVLIFVKYII